jgi:hypothetical protein
MRAETIRQQKRAEVLKKQILEGCRAASSLNKRHMIKRNKSDIKSQ